VYSTLKNIVLFRKTW